MPAEGPFHRQWRSRTLGRVRCEVLVYVGDSADPYIAAKWEVPEQYDEDAQATLVLARLKAVLPLNLREDEHAVLRETRYHLTEEHAYSSMSFAIDILRPDHAWGYLVPVDGLFAPTLF